MFSFEKSKIWTHLELETSQIKISTIWCIITQAGNMWNENTSTASLHSKEWFHEDEEAKFM